MMTLRPGTWNVAPGTRHLRPSTWDPPLGSRFLKPDSWDQTHGSKIILVNNSDLINLRSLANRQFDNYNACRLNFTSDFGKANGMAERSNERLAWFNGEFMPESQVKIPFRDLSWIYGDGCFDMTRSFGHRPFKVKEHVERLYRTLNYLRIDPGIGAEKMMALTEELFERNRHLLQADEDFWIGQRISRGVRNVPGDNLESHGPNVVLECVPLPLQQRAKSFKEGIKVVIPSHRRTPPECLTPRAKTHNYLNMVVANHEVQSIDPEAWAVLLDINGNLAEGMGSNIFVVRDGVLLTPSQKYVLPGISRQTVIDLAEEEGIPVKETDVDQYDSYNADEIFLTSTSLCLCPVTSINGARIGAEGQVWGPITQRLADAYKRYVDHDFVAQYMNHYEDGMMASAF